MKKVTDNLQKQIHSLKSATQLSIAKIREQTEATQKRVATSEEKIDTLKTSVDDNTIRMNKQFDVLHKLLHSFQAANQAALISDPKKRQKPSAPSDNLPPSPGTDPHITGGTKD